MGTPRRCTRIPSGRVRPLPRGHLLHDPADVEAHLSTADADTLDWICYWRRPPVLASPLWSLPFMCSRLGSPEWNLQWMLSKPPWIQFVLNCPKWRSNGPMERASTASPGLASSTRVNRRWRAHLRLSTSPIAHVLGPAFPLLTGTVDFRPLWPISTSRSRKAAESSRRPEPVRADILIRLGQC